VRGQRRRRAPKGLRDLILRERLDLWFCPFTNLEPRVCPVASVITVHDLQHEYYPQFFHPDELRHRRHFYPESCAVADHVIAVSEFTRSCVIERYGVEPDRVSAIWEAAGSDFDWSAAQERVPAIRRHYALPSDYVLYPANTWRHKNHLRLVEAVARYRRLYGEGLTLVLTGVGKEGQTELEQAIEGHGLAGSIRILGYVPRADLPALYAAAGCLALPSLFEGFGIPLVEAMLVGCPIVAANGTSLPEIAGDAAVLFDPLDPADICRALAAVLRDEAKAGELRRRGRARAAVFSASRMAEQTLQVFERVVRDGWVKGRDAGREVITVEGVYDDQWMGGEAVFSILGRSLVSFEVEGHLPGLDPIVPQALAVRVGDQPTQVVSLNAAGPFSFSVPLDSNGGSLGAWRVSLTPDRTFSPMAYGTSPDSRDLSVQLLRLRARSQDGRQIVKTLGSPGHGGAC
jgi:glycosyltransferase involved in cell wall biosynthesis